MKDDTLRFLFSIFYAFEDWARTRVPCEGSRLKRLEDMGIGESATEWQVNLPMIAVVPRGGGWVELFVPKEEGASILELPWGSKFSLADAAMAGWIPVSLKGLRIIPHGDFAEKKGENGVSLLPGGAFKLEGTGHPAIDGRVFSLGGVNPTIDIEFVG